MKKGSWPDRLEMMRRLSREQLADGMEVPAALFAYKGDTLLGHVVLRNFERSYDKQMAFMEAATILPTLGADRAFILMDIWYREMENRSQAEAEKVFEHGLKDDPNATDAICVISMGDDRRAELKVMPYHRNDRGVVIWGKEINAKDAGMESWMIELLQKMLDFKGAPPPVSVTTLALAKLGHHATLQPLNPNDHRL